MGRATPCGRGQLRPDVHRAGAHQGGVMAGSNGYHPNEDLPGFRRMGLSYTYDPPGTPVRFRASRLEKGRARLEIQINAGTPAEERYVSNMELLGAMTIDRWRKSLSTNVLALEIPWDALMRLFILRVSDD